MAKNKEKIPRSMAESCTSELWLKDNLPNILQFILLNGRLKVNCKVNFGPQATLNFGCWKINWNTGSQFT